MTLILCRTLALIGCARVPAVRTQRGDKRPEMSSGVGGARGHVIGASAAAPAHAPSSTSLAFPGSWHLQVPRAAAARRPPRPERCLRRAQVHGRGPALQDCTSGARLPYPLTRHGESASPAPERALGRQRCPEESIRPPKSHPRIPCALTPQRKQASACGAVWVLFLLVIANLLLHSHPLLSSKRPQSSRHRLSGHKHP